VQLGFVVADAGVLDQREGIAQDRLRLIDPTDLATGLGQQGQPMRNLDEHKLLLVALQTLRKAIEHFDATGQVGNGFHVRGTLDRALARAPPVGDGLLCKPRLGEMLGHEFGLPLDDVGKVAFKRRGDPRM
jgi:hypothetical protein